MYGIYRHLVERFCLCFGFESNKILSGILIWICWFVRFKCIGCFLGFIKRRWKRKPKRKNLKIVFFAFEDIVLFQTFFFLLLYFPWWVNLSLVHYTLDWLLCAFWLAMFPAYLLRYTHTHIYILLLILVVFALCWIAELK